MYRHGPHTLRHVAVAMLVGGLGLVSVLLPGVNSQIPWRLTRLSMEVSRAGRSANPRLRTTRQQADELGNVADVSAPRLLIPAPRARIVARPHGFR